MIDRILFRLAGLTNAEAEGLEQRHSRMLGHRPTAPGLNRAVSPLRWAGIVAIGVPFPDLPVPAVNDYFRSLVRGDLPCGLARLRLRVVDAGRPLISLAPHSFWREAPHAGSSPCQALQNQSNAEIRPNTFHGIHTFPYRRKSFFSLTLTVTDRREKIS